MDIDSQLGPYLSIFSDRGFKAAFGNPKNKEFLCRSLTALTQSPSPIKEVTFVENDYAGISVEDRGARLDLVCEDDLGQQFIVEMQVQRPQHFIHRAKHYAFHVFNRMVKKGNYHFNDLKNIYMVSFLAKQAYSTNLYHQIANLKNQNGELVDSQITHVVVELGKFNKALNEVKTDLDKLLYTMKQTANKDFQEAAFMREQWLATALKELETANLTADERMNLELDIAHRVTYEDDLKIEGAESRSEETAIRMLKKGRLTVEEIAEYTQLPIHLVSALAQKLY